MLRNVWILKHGYGGVGKFLIGIDPDWQTLKIARLCKISKPSAKKAKYKPPVRDNDLFIYKKPSY